MVGLRVRGRSGKPVGERHCDSGKGNEGQKPSSGQPAGYAVGGRCDSSHCGGAETPGLKPWGGAPPLPPLVKCGSK